MSNGQMLNLGGNLPPEILQQQQALNRQQQMAQLLMQQGMNQPQGQMVSGRFVAPSFFQYAAPLAQLYAGTRLQEKGDKAMADLLRSIQTGKQAETQAIIEKLPTDVQGAMALALQSQYGAGKELLPTLVQRALPEPNKPTTDMQNYEYAKSQGFKGSFNDFKQQITPYQQEQLKLDREKFDFEKQNKALGKDLTEAQGKASAFQSQMVSASNAVKTLENAGFDPTSFKSQTAVRLAGGVANPAIPATAQQYKQAQEQWSEAYLRFKTGAAATEQEVQRNVKTFFPQFGDKPEQIAQKAAMREQAERDVGIAAGRGAGLGAQPIAATPTPTAPSAPMFAVNPETGARIQSTDGGKTWKPAPKR